MKKIVLLLMILSTWTMATTTWLNPNAGDTPVLGTVGCTNAYQCVDEGYPPSTTDYIYPDTALMNCTASSAFFNFENLPASATQVDYIVIYYYAMTDVRTVWLPGGVRSFRIKNIIVPHLSEGGDVYIDTVHSRTTTSSYQYHYVAYQLNPMTGEAWTVSEVNNLRAGYCIGNYAWGARLAQMDILVSYD